MSVWHLCKLLFTFACIASIAAVLLFAQWLTVEGPEWLSAIDGQGRRVACPSLWLSCALWMVIAVVASMAPWFGMFDEKK